MLFIIYRNRNMISPSFNDPNFDAEKYVIRETGKKPRYNMEKLLNIPVDVLAPEMPAIDLADVHPRWANLPQELRVSPPVTRDDRVRMAMRQMGNVNPMNSPLFLKVSFHFIEKARQIGHVKKVNGLDTKVCSINCHCIPSIFD